MVPEDKIDISIQGLTNKQKLMLSIMWNINSKKQLYYWLDALNKEDRQEATCLLIMLKQEILEEILDEDCTDAKEVLSKFIFPK